jgi:hypothetical protein
MPQELIYEVDYFTNWNDFREGEITVKYINGERSLYFYYDPKPSHIADVFTDPGWISVYDFERAISQVIPHTPYYTNLLSNLNKWKNFNKNLDVFKYLFYYYKLKLVAIKKREEDDKLYSCI